MKRLAEMQLRDYNGLKSRGGSENKDKKQMSLVNIYAHKTLKKEREARVIQRFLRLPTKMEA